MRGSVLCRRRRCGLGHSLIGSVKFSLQPRIMSIIRSRINSTGWACFGMKSGEVPSSSVVTRICPSQFSPQPIPMVGMSTNLVISPPTFRVTPSIPMPTPPPFPSPPPSARRSPPSPSSLPFFRSPPPPIYLLCSYPSLLPVFLLFVFYFTRVCRLMFG